MYNYCRYTLSLDPGVPEQKNIINYLESFAQGRKRNNALVALLLDKTDNGNILSGNGTYTDDIQLSIIDKKLDKILNELIRDKENPDNVQVPPPVAAEYVQHEAPQEEVKNPLVEKPRVRELTYAEKEEYHKMTDDAEQIDIGAFISTPEESVQTQPAEDEFNISEDVLGFLNSL